MTTLAMAAPPLAPVSCALCGHEYTPGGDSCREHGCPVAFGGCTTRHCPRCGYSVPVEEGSVALRFFRKLFGRQEPVSAGTLAELPAGTRGVVDRLEGDPELLSRLTAQGLAPGVEVHVLQRLPTFVIELGETTIAMERRVAQAIRLRRPPDSR